MRYSIPVKFIAILLCAISAVVGCVSVLGIIQVVELGLYTDGFDNWVQNRMQWQASSLAEDLTERYAVRELTNCPDQVLEELGFFYVFQDSVHWTGLEAGSYGFVITDEEGGVLAEEPLPQGAKGMAFQIPCAIRYPVQVTQQDTIDAQYGTDYLSRETVLMEAYDGKPVTIRYYESPQYTVELELVADSVLARSGTSLRLVEQVYIHRYTMILTLVGALAVFAAGLVYLCCAAGRTGKNSGINPGALNRFPLDLYFAAGAIACYGLGLLAVEMIQYWIFDVDRLNPGTLTILGLVLLCIGLIGVGFLFALAAQVKGRNYFWWHHSVIGWTWGKLFRAAAWCFRKLCKLMSLLPVIWRYLLIGCAMGFFPLLFLYMAAMGDNGWLLLMFLCVAADVLVILYGAYAYGTLLRGAEQMVKGQLHTKIDTRFLLGSYKQCAQQLNALADTALEAAKKQMRSERMKTELITNVSHDIKTPLTSIINYVDLLQSAKTAQESAQYLEVLGRQSQRLKKLIQDLVEMSRASSGSMPVEIVRLDPVEALNQAFGEFSDKLSSADLTVVFRQPEQPVAMYADGRMTWRVLSNLLSNIVKYALPGTRVYADLLTLGDQVVISLKNISREPLNISADELTERFVRGDASRNTEGSGLGLNIAQSLMELQKGQLQLLVDGDLFKVTLYFPVA